MGNELCDFLGFFILCLRNVVSIDDYAACFENIDPLAPHKKWTTKHVGNPDSAIRDLVHRERIQAAFILSDPVDWSRDIQVIWILDKLTLHFVKI